MMTAIMGMATLSIIISILVLYLYHHPTTTRAPFWLRKFIFKYVARAMCIQHDMPHVDGVSN